MKGMFLGTVLLISLCLSPAGNTVPQAKSLSGESSAENPRNLTVQDLPFLAVDIATDGNYLYAGLGNGSIMRTADGESWTKLGGWYHPSGVYALRITSAGTLFVGANTLYYPLYHSTDHGETFTMSMDSSTYWHNVLLWNLDEDSAGNVWLATYGGKAFVLESTSQGSYGSWVLKLNAAQDFGAYHMHEIFVDNETDYIYASYGDKIRGDIRSTDGGNTWAPLPVSRGVTAIRKFEEYRYFGQDNNPNAIHRTKDDVNFEVAMETPCVPFSGVNNTFSIFSLTNSLNGVMYAGTYIPPTLWATWDGLQWIELFDLTSYGVRRSVRRIEQFKNWIYVVGTAFSFRFPALDKTNLKNMQWYDSVLNGNQVTATQYFYDGMNQSVYFNHVLENATLKVRAKYSENLVRNPSFETWDSGLPTEWQTSDTGITVTEETTNKLFGSKSVKVNVTNTASSLLGKTGTGNNWVEISPFRWYVVSAYVKVVASTPTGSLRPMFVLDQWDEAGGYIQTISRSSWDAGDGMWHRISWTVYSAQWYSGQLKGMKYWRYSIKAGSMFSQPWVAWYLDGFQIQLAEPISNMTDSNAYLSQKTLAHNYTENEIASSNKLLTPFRNYGTYLSNNISFTLNGQTYSFNDVINDTERAVANFTSIFGPLDLRNISITSGIAEIIISGLRRVTLTPYGQAYITSYAFSNNRMNLTVSTQIAHTSLTAIYCGDKSEPKSIYVSNGALSWNFNASTSLLELQVSHYYNLARVIVDWRTPGDVNADGEVDSSDLTALSEAYGSLSNAPNWNENCDFNADNIINISDLYPLGKNYQATP